MGPGTLRRRVLAAHDAAMEGAAAAPGGGHLRGSVDGEPADGSIADTSSRDASPTNARTSRKSARPVHVLRHNSFIDCEHLQKVKLSSLEGCAVPWA